MKNKKLLEISVLVLASMAILYGGCATGPQTALPQASSGNSQSGEIIIHLNRTTVAVVRPEKATSGYGLRITLNDRGWYQIREIRQGQSFMLMVNGQVMSREIAVGSAFPREFFWVRSLGEDELTLDRAQALSNEIMEK